MNKRFLFGLIGSVVINVLTWVALFTLIPKTDNSVVLHYNIYFGIDLVGQWNELLYVPITGLVIIILNTILSLLFSKKAALLSSVLEISALIIQIVLLVSVLLIVPINTV